MFQITRRGYVRASTEVYEIPMLIDSYLLACFLQLTEQLQLVQSMWRHRQAGLPPREAYQRALREQSKGQLSIWPE